MGTTVIKLGEVGQLKFIDDQNTQRGLCIIKGSSIAGTRHVGDVSALAQRVSTGERFSFERDYNNAYDRWSVRVYGKDHTRLGYVSDECNEVVARLMDGGKRVSGRCEGVSQIDETTRIKMGVYLDD